MCNNIYIYIHIQTDLAIHADIAYTAKEKERETSMMALRRQSTSAASTASLLPAHVCVCECAHDTCMSAHSCMHVHVCACERAHVHVC